LRGSPDFLECMIEASRSLLALNALSARSDARAIREAVDDAARVYEVLLALQETKSPDPGDSIRVRFALDLLRSRLKFFGRPV
jgi:hypothetical protein